MAEKDAQIQRIKDDSQKRDEDYYEKTLKAQELAEQMQKERDEEREARRKLQKEVSDHAEYVKRTAKEIEELKETLAAKETELSNATGEALTLQQVEDNWQKALDNALSDLKDTETKLTKTEGELATAVYTKNEFFNMLEQKEKQLDGVMDGINNSVDAKQLDKILDTFYEVFGELSEGMDIENYLEHMKKNVQVNQLQREGSQASLPGFGDVHGGRPGMRGDRQVSSASVGDELRDQGLGSEDEQYEDEDEDGEEVEAEDEEVEEDQEEEDEDEVEDADEEITGAQDQTLTATQHDKQAAAESEPKPNKTTPNHKGTETTENLVPRAETEAEIKDLKTRLMNAKATLEIREKDRQKLGEGAKNYAMQIKKLKDENDAVVQSFENAKRAFWRDQVEGRDLDISNYKKHLKDRDAEVAKQRTEIAKRDEEIVKRGEEIAKRDEEIVKRGEEIVKRGEEIAKRKKEIVKRDDEILKRDEGIVKRDDDIVKRDEEIATFKARPPVVQNSNEDKIIDLENALREKTREMEDLKNKSQGLSFSGIDSQSTAPVTLDHDSPQAASQSNNFGFSTITSQSTAPDVSSSSTPPQPTAQDANLGFSAIISQSTAPIVPKAPPPARRRGRGQLAEQVRIQNVHHYHYRGPWSTHEFWTYLPFWIKTLLLLIFGLLLAGHFQLWRERARWFNANDVMHQELIAMTSGRYYRGFDWKSLVVALIGGGDTGLLG